jgi:hypothetical protein
VFTAVAVLVARKAFHAEASADRVLGWAFVEGSFRNSFSMLACFALTLVGLVSYPIAIGVVYFSGDVPSDHVTTWVLRLTIGLSFFVAVPVVILSAIWTLSSPNIGEALRSRQLVSLAVNMLTFGLYLSLFLWSFQLSGPSGHSEASRSVLSLSPTIAGALFGYFLFVVLVPYGIGTSRALRQERSFLEAEELILGRLIVALERPHDVKLGSALRRTRRELDELRQQSMRENSVLALAAEGQRLDPGIRSALPSLLARTGLSSDLKATYEQIRSDRVAGLTRGDPRILYWEQLVGVRLLIDEIGFTLARLSDGRPRELAVEWAKFVRRRREDIDHWLSSRPRTRIPAWLTISGLLAPVVSVVLGQLGSELWALVANSFSGR